MLTKPSQIRELGREEVRQRLETIQQELFNLRFRKGAKQGLTNPLRLRILRREVARIQTILGEDVRSEKRFGTSGER